MNLLNHEFFVFRNAENEEVNIVYKRHDGNYGGAWENSLFKAAMDGVDPAAESQRAYTDEFLINLCQDRAVGGYDNGNRTYDGEDNGYVFFNHSEFAISSLPCISPEFMTVKK